MNIEKLNETKAALVKLVESNVALNQAKNEMKRLTLECLGIARQAFPYDCWSQGTYRIRIGKQDFDISDQSQFDKFLHSVSYQAVESTHKNRREILELQATCTIVSAAVSFIKGEEQ